MSPTRTGNVLNWASDLDAAALAQAQRAASMPFVAGHLALMPDAHVGKGATIGSVIPTRGAIIPSAVGVDIGCGMIAAELPFDSNALPDDLRPLHDRISQVVPAGVGRGHDTAQDAAAALLHDDRAEDLDTKQQRTAATQMGSLGSGNHFVEVCLDERDRVWVVLHSGSRGIGNRLAQRHIEAAKGLMRRWFIDLEDQDLAYLVEGTPEFEDYVRHMLWAQDYALANREVMMDAVLRQVADVLGTEVVETRRVNCHHNFTQLEHHHDKDVWITRKGAIRARAGDVGVIPGSMGTRSYIVEGVGNPASYCSCSHGAGRRLSRGQARRTLDLEGLRARMAGRAWNSDQAEQLLDEDPRSYKDIDQVMADQEDLVSVQHTLQQVLNYKGT
jgi:tRNA-splicing ligase RtcB